ncbi:JmjC domain-containing protein [Sphingomonas hengshuiensis]|uniref:JmjC domain-containing protein n=1 Tax=Sphingomonas hengshuiensis TaxID=1609977 RepID=A0A7U4J6T9_9SPHN|nr:cupin domain-containing protein [Sphingomonas hengshuiensis]AJP71182.1 hypothetical protein TS85_04170 [Sphingomonas hengshuiensis]
MITSFADLLHPHDPAALRAAAASGTRLLLRTDRARQFAGLMPWERFNDLVTADRVLAGDIEFARNNAILPAEMTILRPKRQKPPTRMRAAALHHYAQQGVSTVINGVERFDSETRRLNAIFERAFRAPVKTNLYASFGRDSAFKPHWDGHNVLVLHLHGRKHWRSWGQPWRAPLSHATCKVPDVLGEPEWEAVLEPGDILYLPRGEVHAAALAPGEDAMHLTIGIATPGFEALTAALAEACQAEEIGRQDLPILADAAQKQAWLTAAKQLLHRAVDALDLDAVLTLLDQRVEPLQAGFLGVDRRVHPDTRVVPTLRRPLGQAGAHGEPGRTVQAGTQSWTLEGIECHILALVMADAGHTVASLSAALPEIDATSVRDGVITLARKGLVTVRN